MRQWVRRAALPALVGMSASLAGPVLPSAAAAVSPDIVISQVYGGGGNFGATYTNDFIELYNRGASAVDVTGWSVQYASAPGSSWSVTVLNGSIAPGSHYLIQEAAGPGGTTPLPTPDATGGIALSAVSGKVAVVTTNAALTCGVDCDAAVGVHDLAGYGAANDFEAAAAPGLSNTTAALRDGGGSVDTDNNSADFAEGAPNPRNSGSAAEADLAVDKGDSNDPVLPGANLTYTITVTNNGPDVAEDAELTDTLPAGTTFVSLSSPGGWTATTPPVGGTGTVTATTSSLAVGAATFTLIVTVNPAATGTITNSSGITSATHDPNTSNNADSEDTVIGPASPVCTITGTQRNDVLNGTPGNDVICGLGGNDIINGLGGDDTIHGGPGRDLISGGSGSDTVYGEGDGDILSVADRVRGNDTVDGGPGFDLCSADPLDGVLSCP